MYKQGCHDHGKVMKNLEFEGRGHGKLMKFQGWKLQNLCFGKVSKTYKLPALFLPVQGPGHANRQGVFSIISAFPSEKCLKFLLVRLYFYLYQTGGQPISISGNYRL